MIQPYLSNEEWTYVPVQGLIWLHNGLKLPTNLEEKACSAIAKVYQESNIGKPLLLDFRNIKDVADRALDSLFSIFNTSDREVLLLNYDAISDQIDRVTTQNYKKERKDFYIDAHCRILNPLSLEQGDFITKIKQQRLKNIEELVRSSFVQFTSEQHLSSTPFKSNGVFDASKLLSNHSAFFWISLELSDMLRQLINNRTIALNRELRLLSVSLKSSPFASIVSLQNAIPLITIDHLGPKHKVFDVDILEDLQNLNQYNYIYVGDFCVGGTEIKIAKTYASISNSELTTAIVIGSYFEPEVFKSAFNLHSLVSINGLHPKAQFSI